MAFRVDINGLIWSYELQPTEHGTRVIESRHAENGAKPVANFAVNAFYGGVPSFERELVEGAHHNFTSRRCRTAWPLRAAAPAARVR